MTLLDVAVDEKRFAIGGIPTPVLSDIRLSAAEGEVVALLGPSGSGKSTLLRIIAGLDTDFSGTVTVDGTAVRGPGLDRGLVFQQPALLPWLDVRQNVRFALPRRRRPGDDERVREVIAQVGLAGRERALPATLSGGMAQRAALARALVNLPRVLLLDEPFAALDAFTRARMQQQLAAAIASRAGATVLVTHDIDEALLLSDRLVLLAADPGRILTTMPVELPRPRARTQPELIEMRARVLDTFAPVMT